MPGQQRPRRTGAAKCRAQDKQLTYFPRYRNFLTGGGEYMSVKRLEAKHPRAIRWVQWINFPLLIIMIWSGLLIYWANDVYITFPDWFYNWFSIGHRLAEGMAWHFLFMWLFAINGVAYVIYTVVSGEWRYLLPNRNSLREAWQVLLHDLHLSKTKPPRRKFHDAQQIPYTSIN